MVATTFFGLGGGVLNKYKIWPFMGSFVVVTAFFEVGGGRSE